jgi:hypothetical protein
MAAKPKSDLGPAGRPYLPGDYYSFHTAPATEFAAPETGRYAALKIIGVDDECYCLAILDGVFDRHPELAEVAQRPVSHADPWSSQEGPAVAFIGKDAPNDLLDMRFLGAGEVTASDGELMAECSSYFHWSTCSLFAEGGWRWRHDHTVYEDELARARAAASARMAAEAERWRTRLKGLTWEKILSETPFANWDTLPPPDFAAAAREEMHRTVRALQALGPKPPRREVRAILKACVEWFNQTDEAFGGVIETAEREDIYQAIEELAVVARQKALIPEIDEWRAW